MLPIGTPGVQVEHFGLADFDGSATSNNLHKLRESPELQELVGKADDPITIVVCGLTGTGKSSLCGLLSQNRDCKESNGFASVTMTKTLSPPKKNPSGVRFSSPSTPTEDMDLLFAPR